MFARLGRPHAAWLGRCGRLAGLLPRLGPPRRGPLGRSTAALLAWLRGWAVSTAPCLGLVVARVGRAGRGWPRCLSFYSFCLNGWNL